MAGLGAVASVASAGMGFFGALQQGSAAQVAGEYQNAADVQKGKEDFAASQRSEIEKQREGDLVMSKEVAGAAASGGGVVNPSIKDIYSDTAGRSNYLADTALYQGEERQQAMDIEGQNALFKGNVASDASFLQGIGSAAGSLSKTNFGAFG